MNEVIGFNDENVVLLVDKKGRKTNSYLIKLGLEETIMKEYLRDMKKKFGCNGSIKNIIYENLENRVIHLQGEHTDRIIDYMSNKGVKDIIIKDY
jgi:translation initiation factor 1 (eIF-1/SUI1)